MARLLASGRSRSSSLSLDSLKAASLSNKLAKSRSNISTGGTAGSKLSRGASQQNLYGLITLGETAGICVDDFEADVVSPKKRISRLDIQQTDLHGKSGEELLVQKTQSPNLEGLEKFTQLNKVRDVEKKGMDKNVLQRVIIEDERQVTACLTLPSTFVFFCLFMLLFQQHYTTSYLHLQEATLRKSFSNSANSVDNIEGIWDWMTNSFLPWIYSTDQTLGESPTTSITGGGEWLQQIGGILLRSQRSQSLICEDEIFQNVNYSCHPQDTVNTSGRIYQEDARFGYLGGWKLTQEGESRRLKASERLYPQRSADPGNWLDVFLAYMSRWFPGQATYVKAGSWKSTSDGKDISMPSAIESKGGSNIVDQTRRSEASQYSKESSEYAFRKANAPTGKPFKKSLSRKQQQQQATGLGIFDDPFQAIEDSSGTHSIHPKHLGRELKTSRPEFGMLGWIPYPFVKKNVWEYVVPMSMPLDQVKSLMQYWKQGRLIDRSNLFFGVEVILRNPDIGEGVLTHVFINFVFSRGGHIYVESIFQSLVLADDKFVIFFGLVWIMLLVFNTIVTPARTCLAWKRRKFREHCWSLVNVLEWLVVFYGWVVVAVFMAERWGTRKFNSQFKDYRDSRANQDAASLPGFDVEWFDKIHQNVFNTGTIDIYLLTIIANFHLFLVLRYFVASRGQSRLAIVVNTFRDASVDLLHLLVVFGIIFFAYIVSGHILFGRRMEEFATLEGAMAYTIQIVLNREFDFQTLSSQDFFTTVFWVYTFVILVVIIMINIVLAMIFDIYGEVRGNISVGESLLDTFRTVYRRMKMHKVWVPNGELLIITKKLPHDKITLKMIKKAVPGIPKEQVAYLFDKAKAKFDTVMMRSNRNAQTEALAAVLLGISQAKDGVAYMSGLIHSREELKQRSLSHLTDQPSMTSIGSPTSSKSRGVLTLSRESVRDDEGQPVWLQRAWFPIMAKHEHRMDEVSARLEKLRKWYQQRGVGILTSDSEYPKPTVPWEDGGLVLPWPEERITVFAGRTKRVAPPPPVSTLPSRVGKRQRSVASPGVKRKPREIMLL